MKSHGRHSLEEIGQLTDLDETLNHQIVDTFATVVTPDHSWTEKIWVALIRKDGGMGIDFGMGRYHNRGIMDGFAAVSRGAEQWTVRGSRELREDPTELTVGPLTYEIVDPLHQVRFELAKNDIQPIAFDFTFTSVLPPFFEQRHREREEDGFRVGGDIIRYHQCGKPSGWVELEGERIDITPEDWWVVRDHSWGTRLDVGLNNPDIRPSGIFGASNFGQDEFSHCWTPFTLRSPSGELVSYHIHHMSKRGKVFYSSGFRNLPDGSQEKISRIRPELSFDDRTRRLLGGRLHFDMLQGDTRTVEIEVVGTSGVHLGPALYLGFRGRKHGAWRGKLDVEGEKFDNTLDVETLKEIHQLRDCPIRVTEGDWTGYGIMETIMHGEHPKLGLTKANSLL